jgi:hypothetical protein
MGITSETGALSILVLDEGEPSAGVSHAQEF